MSEVDAQLRTMVADLTQAAVPSSGDVRFSELAGWDSVTHLHLLLDVERTFGLEIPDAVGMRLDSLVALRDYVALRRAGGG